MWPHLNACSHQSRVETFTALKGNIVEDYLERLLHSTPVLLVTRYFSVDKMHSAAIKLTFISKTIWNRTWTTRDRSLTYTIIYHLTRQSLADPVAIQTFLTEQLHTLCNFAHADNTYGHHLQPRHPYKTITPCSNKTAFQTACCRYQSDFCDISVKHLEY